ncbi:hypothetical protein RyT2_09510 [Pseudolactococcus yaeyamensis]
MAIGNDLDTYHQDGLKSNITQISKENGRLYSSNLYKEFGSSERRINDQAGYRSQYHDNSADIHLRAREYNTNTGRFLQQDTVLGSLNNPTTQNKYIYGNNNPFMYRDDAGRFGWNDIVNGVKKAVKAVAKAVDRYIVKPVVKAVQSGANWVNKNIVQPVVNFFTGGGSSSSSGGRGGGGQPFGGWTPQPNPLGNNSLYGQTSQNAVINGQVFDLNNPLQFAQYMANVTAQETRKKGEIRIQKQCDEADKLKSETERERANLERAFGKPDKNGRYRISDGAGHETWMSLEEARNATNREFTTTDKILLTLLGVAGLAFLTGGTSLPVTIPTLGWTITGGGTASFGVVGATTINVSLDAVLAGTIGIAAAKGSGDSGSNNSNLSTNGINEQIKKGKTPNGVERADKGFGDVEDVEDVEDAQDHLHFDDSRWTLNRDGSWGHNGSGTPPKLTNAIKKWLKEIGWGVPE